MLFSWAVAAEFYVPPSATCPSPASLSSSSESPSSIASSGLGLPLLDAAVVPFVSETMYVSMVFYSVFHESYFSGLPDHQWVFEQP